MTLAKQSFNILLFSCIELTIALPVEDLNKKNGLEGESKTVNVDVNITNVCEQLRSLDKDLTQMFNDPPEDKGDDMLAKLKSYNYRSMDLLGLTNLDKRKVFKVAKDMLDYGGPHFLNADVHEEKIKDSFKWEQDTMDKVSMMRLKIGEHWFDLWNMYKNLPDYDIPANH